MNSKTFKMIALASALIVEDLVMFFLGRYSGDLGIVYIIVLFGLIIGTSYAFSNISKKAFSTEVNKVKKMVKGERK